MRDEDWRGLRRLAEEQDSAAAWSRLAAAHLRVGQFDEAGEALVRARAVGEADPAIEDLLEEASLDDAVLRVADMGARELVDAPAWSPDSRRLFFHEDDSIWSWALGDERTRIGEAGSARVMLACSLDGRFVVLSTTSSVETRRIATGSKSPAVSVPSLHWPGHAALSSWGAGGTIAVASHRRLTTFELAEGGSLWPQATTAIEEPFSLCWNGTAVPWPEGQHKRLPDGVNLPTGRSLRFFAAKAAILERSRDGDRPFPGLAFSPSGRFAAQWYHDSPELEVVDFCTEVVRPFRMPSTPADAVWSPSGRRLAVAMLEGLAIIELGAEPLAALDSQWRAAIAFDGHDDTAFFKRLETDRRPAVSEWLLRQLEPIPDDAVMPFRVAAAARALARRRELVDLARVRAARAKLPARSGGFRDYRGVVDHLIRVLEGLERGERCSCGAGFRTPGEHGALEEISAVRREGAATLVYRCRVCGRRWRVVEDTSFNLPSYDVEEIKE